MELDKTTWAASLWDYFIDQTIDGRHYFESVNCKGACINEPQQWEAKLASITDDELKKIIESNQYFEMEIADMRTGKVYKARFGEPKDQHRYSIQRAKLFDQWQGNNDTEVWSMNDYMIASHFCPCHRVGQIDGTEDADFPDPVGNEDDDTDCVDGVFMIRRTTHSALNMMVVEGDTRGVATWPEFALVRVDGNYSGVVETFENRNPLAQLPDDSCKNMVE